MSRRHTVRIVVAIVVLALGALATPSAPVLAGEPDILDLIRGVPGVVSVEEADANGMSYRFFRVEFEQPVDHANPAGPKFRQRLTVLHYGLSNPNLLQINGYYVNPDPVEYELTSLFLANQIHVEHRYFVPSRPDPVDWRYLDIAQSAADHHEIVRAFKTIYTGSWAATGVSKGGMASVYYRYFYPDDVDVTIAYVAPTSHGTRDARYAPFVASLGSEECRAKLLAFQRRALKKREKLLRFMGDGPYDVLGKDRALEFAILELPFIFWQYNDESLCDRIPGPKASARRIYEFLDQVVFVPSYGDQSLTAFEPYFYQSAPQLGGPAVGEAELEDLLRYPGQDGPEILPPLGVTKTFDPTVMPEIERFVREDAERMVFIYGENDPWSASAFEVNEEKDSYRFFVTGAAGNHGAQILDLAPGARDFLIFKFAEWLGTAVPRAADLAPDARRRIARPTRQELYLR
jgi:hypothetical protein